MTASRAFFWSLTLLPLLVWAPSAIAADFGRALSFPKRTENRVFRDRVSATWLPDGRSFWYRVQTGPQQHEVVLVDAATGERKSGQNLIDLGVSPREASTLELKVDLHATKRTGLESGIKFINKLDSDVDLFWVNTEGEHVRYGSIKAGSEHEQHTFEGHVWLITSRTGEHLAVVEGAAIPQVIIIDGMGIPQKAPEPKTGDRQKQAESGGEPEGAVISPDGLWSAFIKNGVVMLRIRRNGRVTPLETTLDGNPRFRGKVTWAPDSSTLVACACMPVAQRTVAMVDSSPQGQLQPRLKELDYTKPGDPLPQPFPVIFHLHPEVQDFGDDDTPVHEYIPVRSKLCENAFIQALHFEIRWSPDSREFYFSHNRRGHQLYRIIAVDARTGAARAVVEETSSTFIDHVRKTWRHWLDKSGELLWMSERDGWCHLWLYDVATGKVKNQITQGKWPVREVLHVDEQKRQVWFLASGLRQEEDPYHLHLCRVAFDGGGFTRLTQGDGNHHIAFSPARDFFIDTWSRVDHPPVHELRRSADGGLVCVLEKADASRLLAAGWTQPERIVAKGRDGRTDIHGILIKPSHFDPARKYPVVEDIYAGPHSAFVPKDFDRLVRMHQIAELGFILVRMDGMGTSHRGKVFHDVCWKNLKDAGFPDRKAWIQEAARTRPWMDLQRVGIYGGSAGGQSAMRALLDHHDFYHVAVADCGCHDNRMDKIWWNEQWLGWPVDDSYARNSNVDDAHKLKGHLLLIVGELDTNVDPASTTQVVGALQKAGKTTFDYMPIIGAGHGAAETPFGSRLRMEFLVRHLQP